MNQASIHWADIYADKIIREKGEKDLYTCASGVTPSGTVHIGNFREVISVDLVVRALREKGKQVRFLYSWDEYDVFRKVPANMPNQEKLTEYLRRPITLVPDPYGKEKSYARHNEKQLEELLHLVGIDPEYIYQAARYRTSAYAAGIKRALERKDTIRTLLDEHRSSPLPEDWMPVSVFCTSCLRDTTEVTSWNGDWSISYKCSSCNNAETLDLRKTEAAKLPWRIDWPMRWALEKVDFEPAGKDHHSEGGSFDTSRKIVAQIYEAEAPVTFQYDFISIKGRGGKISSSSGEVISLGDVLEVYQPEVVRYLFAGTRPNTEFAISFDLDVLKIYEDYDKCERVYFGQEDVGEKKRIKEKRIYELSQVHRVPERMPFQIPVRHLCNLLQIHSGNITAVLDFLQVPEDQRERLSVRAECAWNWLQTYAPEDFRFTPRSEKSDPLKVNDTERKALNQLYQVVLEMNDPDEKDLAERLYGIITDCEMEPGDFFSLVYRVLIGKEKGPRLAGFILTLGRERVGGLLKKY
ncbi:MAG: lysine--tRNA ligase [Spirochaetales bacterium]|nr:lysine--tRNA ligase [Spirochaetales bacterium]